MLVSPLDVPVVLAVAVVVAFAYSHWLEPHNPDWYAVQKWLTIGVLWVQALLVALAVVDPWLVGQAADVHPIVGVVYVLSYPLWFGWAARRVFVLFGRCPEQGGVLWPLTIRDRTAQFERSWRK